MGYVLRRSCQHIIHSVHSVAAEGRIRIAMHSYYAAQASAPGLQGCRHYSLRGTGPKEQVLKRTENNVY